MNKAEYLQKVKSWTIEDWLNNGHCFVRPRYSAGSGALVGKETALQVAEEEQHFITYHLEGSYGPEKKKFAEETGLKGVAYVRVQRFNTLYIFDLITKEIDIVEI